MRVHEQPVETPPNAAKNISGVELKFHEGELTNLSAVRD
jgi:hypothetical protein